MNRSGCVLAIETSCDETAAAVVAGGGREVRASVVSSQIALHAPYGGVVPEIASRSHIEQLPGVAAQALAKAGADWDGLDAVAVTYGPGLASSLLTGLSMAKGIALRRDLPLILVNHLEAHVYSPLLAPDMPAFEAVCPCIALVVSGGHTCLVRVERPGRMTLIGQTVDDAAGEAFDKGASLLGLGYPGGPAMERCGRDGDAAAVAFPRGKVGKGGGRIDGMQADLCFSFSGLKTALLYHLQRNPLSDDDEQTRSDLAASFQEAIVDALIARTRLAMTGCATLLVGGGVSLNGRLRARLQALADEAGFRLLLSPPAYCGDNAAMIGGVAGHGLGYRGRDAHLRDAEPSLPVALPPSG